MSVCRKLQPPPYRKRVILFVRGAIEAERRLPLMVQTSGELKVAGSHSRVLSVFLPIRPSPLSPISSLILIAHPDTPFSPRPSVWQIFNLVADNEFSAMLYTSRRSRKKKPGSLNFIGHRESCSSRSELRKCTKIFMSVCGWVREYHSLFLFCA